jgi:hypothetical protein
MKGFPVLLYFQTINSFQRNQNILNIGKYLPEGEGNGFPVPQDSILVTNHQGRPGIMKCREGVEPLSCQIPEPISPMSQVPHLG